MAILTQAIETGADAASVVIIGNEYLQRIRDIENDNTLSRAEKDAQINALMYEAAGVGLLMLIGYAGPKMKRSFSRKKIRAEIKKRLHERPGFNLKYTDEQMNEIINHGFGFGLDEKTIEDFLFIGSREAKPIKPDDLIQQMKNWKTVLKKGYPTLFKNLSEFEQFSKVVKNLAAEWNLPSDTIFVQGSSIRLSEVKLIKDLDVAILVDAETFDKLVMRFRESADNQTSLRRIGNNGKIGGIDMFKGSAENGTITGRFYSLFEESFGQKFQSKLEVERIQISVIKKGSSLDTSPFLKLK